MTAAMQHPPSLWTLADWRPVEALTWTDLMPWTELTHLTDALENWMPCL